MGCCFWSFLLDCSCLMNPLLPPPFFLTASGLLLPEASQESLRVARQLLHDDTPTPSLLPSTNWNLVHQVWHADVPTLSTHLLLWLGCERTEGYGLGAPARFWPRWCYRGVARTLHLGRPPERRERKNAMCCVHSKSVRTIYKLVGGSSPSSAQFRGRGGGGASRGRGGGAP